MDFIINSDKESEKIMLTILERYINEKVIWNNTWDNEILKNYFGISKIIR